jgi:hypothetical protein
MASLSGVWNVQEFTDLGELGVGFRLYTYVYGTTTQKTAYTDAAGSIPHTYTADGAGGQYIAMNARGELPAPLYLTAGSYDLTLKRSDGSMVRTRRADPIGADLAGPDGAGLVGWIRNAVGAVIRTIADKFSETASVTDFMSQAQKDSALANGFPDVTGAWNAAFLWAAGTYNTRNKRRLKIPMGSYGLSNTVFCNISTSDFMVPEIVGDGTNSVHIKALAGFPAASPLLKVVGGSPGAFFRQWRGFHMEHLSEANGICIELENTGGLNIDYVSFDKVKSAVRMTTSGGGFAEFNVLGNCWFGYDVQYWLEFYGNSSYNGSGLGPGCLGEIKGTERCVKVSQAGVGDPQIYSTPFNVMVFGDATTVLWEHQGAVPARLHGTIRLETSAACTLGTTTGAIQVFNGSIESLSFEPNEGSMIVQGARGLTGVTVGSDQRFTNPSVAQDVLLQTKLATNTDGAPYGKLRWRGPGGTNVGLTNFDLARMEVTRAGTNANAAGGNIDFLTSPNNATTDAAFRARFDSAGNFLFNTTASPSGGVGGINGLTLAQDGAYSPIMISNNSYNGTGKGQSYYQYNGTVVGTITTSTTGTQYNTTSDYRLKLNPIPLIDSGAFIDSLKPKTWNWVTDGSRGVGFIAHEFQAASPSSVVGEKDAINEDGSMRLQTMQASSAEVIANIVAELQSVRVRMAAIESPSL